MQTRLAGKFACEFFLVKHGGQGYNKVITNYEENEKMDFTTCDYEIVQIDGDYAHLRRTDQPDADLKLVARALLPADIAEGRKLHYEMLQYELTD